MRQVTSTEKIGPKFADLRLLYTVIGPWNPFTGKMTVVRGNEQDVSVPVVTSSQLNDGLSETAWQGRLWHEGWI